MGFSRSGIAGSRKASGKDIPKTRGGVLHLLGKPGSHAAQENFFRTRFPPRDDPAK